MAVAGLKLSYLVRLPPRAIVPSLYNWGLPTSSGFFLVHPVAMTDALCFRVVMRPRGLAYVRFNHRVNHSLQLRCRAMGVRIEI